MKDDALQVYNGRGDAVCSIHAARGMYEVRFNSDRTLNCAFSAYTDATEYASATVSRLFSDDVKAPPIKKARAKTDRSAAGILRTAADVIEQRGQLRDTPEGERSMARAVAAFNELLGGDVQLTEEQGWLFMCVLKMARATAGKPHEDDWTDLAGYAALGGECLGRTGVNHVE